MFADLRKSQGCVVPGTVSGCLPAPLWCVEEATGVMCTDSAVSLKRAHSLFWQHVASDRLPSFFGKNPVGRFSRLKLRVDLCFPGTPLLELFLSSALRPAVAKLMLQSGGLNVGGMRAYC